MTANQTGPATIQ